jgi:hypothetical protein
MGAKIRTVRMVRACGYVELTINTMFWCGNLRERGFSKETGLDWKIL